MILKKIFSEIYRQNTWGSDETRSGGGSEIERTKEVREQLPILLDKLKIRSVLDAGCGDWNWARKIEWGRVNVQACDIVPELIYNNKNNYGRQAHFFQADITKDVLPRVDLILCRTVLFHLSFDNINSALFNMMMSTRYLLMTDHPNQKENHDIQDGDWRRLNFHIDPFHLKKPVLSFADGSGEDGFLSLWDLQHE